MDNDTFSALRERMVTKHQMYLGCIQQRKWILIIDIILNIVGLYLPPEKRVSHLFLQQILSGKKLAIEQRHVTFGRVPNFPELSVEKLWKLIKGDEALLKYLPDGPDVNDQIFK